MILSEKSVIFHEFQRKSSHFQRKEACMARARIAGVIMITSKKTLHTYLYGSTNALKRMNDIRTELRKGKFSLCKPMQEEFSLYGERNFAFGLVDSIIMDLSLNTIEHYNEFVKDAFYEALMSVRPWFNTMYRTRLPWLTMDRARMSRLGTKTTGREKYRYSFLNGKSGFFVLTNKVNGRQYAGYSGDIGSRIANMRVQSRQNSRNLCKVFSDDFNEHGQEAFLVEYVQCEVEAREARETLGELIEKIKPYYTIQGLYYRNHSKRSIAS
jgi:hypothetical protein